MHVLVDNGSSSQNASQTFLRQSSLRPNEHFFIFYFCLFLIFSASFLCYKSKAVKKWRIPITWSGDYYFIYDLIFLFAATIYPAPRTPRFPKSQEISFVSLYDSKGKQENLDIADVALFIPEIIPSRQNVKTYTFTEHL